MQKSVCELSDELIENLAERDELDYEKELKNQFIWLLLCVQKKKREAQADLLHKAGFNRFKILASMRRNANQKCTVCNFFSSQNFLALQYLRLLMPLAQNFVILKTRTFHN